MFTPDLKKFNDNDNLEVHGKLIRYLSTSVSWPVSILPPSQVHDVANMPGRLGHFSLSTSADYVRQGDFNSTVDQNGPLLPGWERRLDPLGRTCFVDYNTRMTTWNKPCPNQSINHVVQDSETNAARDLRFRRLPVDYMVDVANAQATTHPTPSTTALPSAVTTAIAAGYNDWLWQSSNRPGYTLVGELFVTRTPIFYCLSPLSSGWEIRLTSTTHRVYFVDQNTNNDMGLPAPPFFFGCNCSRSQPTMRAQTGNCQVKVQRNHTFEDSYAEITRQTPNDLKKRLMIKFDGEDGLDHSDRSRYNVGVVFSSQIGLLPGSSFSSFLIKCSILSIPAFEYLARDNYTRQINPASGVNPEHLDYFNHRALPYFYKMVLKKGLSDSESVDVEFYHGLAWVCENNITDAIDETFTTTEERLGQLVTAKLKPVGVEINVTEENQKEYVDYIAEYHISKRVKDQFEAFGVV
ncbi:hypothetical protein BKA82DRAFT_18780 [Pisolithus tinctorius]|nr:hypothetical protein BKA82DRAFT_18780 [Pisolithus tinctorius]